MLLAEKEENEEDLSDLPIEESDAQILVEQAMASL